MKKQPPIFRDNAGYTKAYLKELAYQLKADLGWDWMSNDYTIALNEGSNMVRIGSLLFGKRNY